MDSDKQFDLVIVFYEKEIEMLRLLMISINNYCHSNLIPNIFMINNSLNEVRGRDIYLSKIRPLLDIYDGRTILVNTSEYGILNKDENHSYLAQKALKIMIASKIKSDYYLIVDTKNFFIRNLHTHDFFNSEGKPISHLSSYKEGYQKKSLTACLNYFNITEELDTALSNTTPLLMIKEISLDLISKIYTNNLSTIFDLLQKDKKINELLLYFSYIYSTRGLDQVYHLGKRQYVTLFEKWPEKELDIRNVIKRVELKEIYIFGIHSKRYLHLSEDSKKLIFNIWIEKKLFESISECKTFLKNNIDTIKQFKNNLAENDGKVKEGHNGRLYIHNDSNRILSQHLGEILLSPKDILKWRRTIEMRTAYSALNHAKYYILFAPDTHAIYPEDLNELRNNTSTRPILQLLDNIQQHTNVCYPLEQMKNARSIGEVSQKVDSHWSAFGAYIAYVELMKLLPNSLTLLTERDIRLEERMTEGDLGNKFNPPKIGRNTECFVVNPKSVKVWHNNVTNRGHMSIWKNKDRNKPTCLLFTDSYGWKIQRFIAESFSNLIIIHSPLFELDAFEKYKPDYVISLMAERFLTSIPNDLIDKTALSIAQEKDNSIIDYPNIIDKV